MSLQSGQLGFVDKSQVPQGFNIIAPLSGDVKPLTDCHNPILKNGVLGQGVALAITGNKILAPFNGIVSELPGTVHRIQFKAANGIKLMIMLPEQCAQHNGVGFKVMVKANESVKAGQLIANFNPQLLQSLDDQLGAVVLTNPEAIGPIYCSVNKVTAGEDVLLTVTPKARVL